MKTRIVYKVVRRVYGVQLRSAFEKGHPVYYSTEYRSKPHPGTKLFAFLSLKQARDYKRLHQNEDYEIYRAEATGVEKNGWLENHINLVELVEAFRTHKHMWMCEPAPEFNSCVICSSIKLIKKVK